MSKKRFSLIVDVHLFLIKNKKILFLLRKNTGYLDGYFHVPAGHLDGKEKIADALLRESKEEIGIGINPKNVKLVHVMHHKSNDERVGFFFEVKNWQGNARNMEPEKCDQIKWFYLDKLPKKIVPYAKKAIECYLKGVIFSHHGWDQRIETQKKI